MFLFQKLEQVLIVREHKNWVLVYAIMLPVLPNSLLRSLSILPENIKKLLEWHEINMADDVLFTRETSFDIEFLQVLLSEGLFERRNEVYQVKNNFFPNC